jgi:hypothetical protein
LNIRHLIATALIGAVFLYGQGCSKPWVRPYEWKDQQAALETLAARTESVRSVQAACGLTLSDSTGQSVNFDGAIVVRVDPQDQVWLRLRTWKLSQAVFDVTIRPDGVWLQASDEAMKRQSEGLAGVSHEDLAGAWNFMMGRFFSDPGAKVIDEGASEFVVERSKGDVLLRATVDRATLTVREYQIVANGQVQQTLSLSGYRELGPDAVPWPMRIRAAGPDGYIEVRMEDVELNGLIEDSAFVPPKRAVKQDEGKRKVSSGSVGTP